MSDQTNQGKQPEPDPPPLYERGTWLHERDGDLNPTWLMVCGNWFLGMLVCGGALATKDPAAIIAALSYLATTQLALLISALPLAKSKVLARARLGEAVASLGDAANAVLGRRAQGDGTFEPTP